MIVILHELRLDHHCVGIKSALEAKFPGIPVVLVDAGSVTIWPTAETWADVLVVPFDGGALPSNTHLFIQTVLTRKWAAFVLPVAVSAAKAPPAPVDYIKALPWENDGFARCCQRIGARLGLALRSRVHTLFISYRAVDGTGLATQFESFLKGEGYNVWRDDSKDAFDGETTIPPGDFVQREIETNLTNADMVLLLDTPKAWESSWINLEVGLANGNLIPVLPVLFRRPGEKVLCSRFRALDTLQRCVDFDLVGPDAPDHVDPADLQRVLHEMETYLCEIFQRRLRVPHGVARDFGALQYEWSQRDRFVYEAVRKSSGRVVVRVFSHCSFFDGIYDPALRAFVQHLRGLDPRANYALYVYDGTLIPPIQLREIERSAALANRAEVILLHHSEVLTVLTSNFTQRP
ncbi:MAG: hypothetical protein JWR69_4629 [Pedosphaera sp.]|nr:hypothetical protein [Pedosphaera sp.]